MNNQKISFTLNGRKMQREIAPSTILLHFIRDQLGLKGTKPGCGEGECGACTVLIDGQPVNSCLYLAVNIDGKEITTVEGLPQNDPGKSLDPVQQALIDHGGVQCGFCTPGMVMSIKAFKNECDADDIIPGRDEIKKAIEGNLCRCTGYTKIVDAVESLFNSP